MHEYLTYLNSPHLVANFQKTFGIESHFDSNSSSATIDNHQSNHSSKHSKINGIESLEMKKRMSKSKQRVSSGHLNYSSNESTSTLTQTETITIKQNENDTEEPEKTSKHKRTLSGPKKFVNDTDHSHIIAKTTIHSQFWYYMFLLGASMGNEIFYCLFFPFWFWNVDGAIARKVGFLWGIFMYFGQATKDLLCMPRPASPPVVKLEERYKAEYGFPSTHAMVSAGLPLSLVVLSYSRYNINLPISILIASVFCCWVCCSRLYLGMHSLLDVIAGVLYSILVLVIVMPILEPIDNFMIENQFAPLIALAIGYSMCHFYPSLKQWSTARGDTTIIIGSVVGFSVGAFFNNYFGYLNKPVDEPLYDIHFPNALGYLFGVVRTLLGLFILVATRQVFKSSLLKFLCHMNKLDHKDPACKQIKAIELPYNYFTYFIVGFNIVFTSPYLFRLLNIERDYSYTEL